MSHHSPLEFRTVRFCLLLKPLFGKEFLSLCNEVVNRITASRHTFIPTFCHCIATFVPKSSKGNRGRSNGSLFMSSSASDVNRPRLFLYSLFLQQAIGALDRKTVSRLVYRDCTNPWVHPVHRSLGTPTGNHTIHRSTHPSFQP
jgi:hypothetical protein